MNWKRPQTLRSALILSLSVAVVGMVTWFAPSLSATSLNTLFRVRGELPAPSDIIIIAIDDQSLQSLGRRLGPWPWPRSVMAESLEKLAEARPRCVGLDVIYAEPSVPEDDRRLASAIARLGNVILPSQLYEGGDRSMMWLQLLPELERSARAVGHAHVSPEVDGTAHSIQLSKSDDRGNRRWAFGLLIVRAAESIREGDFDELPGFLRIGAHRIPVRADAVVATRPGVSVIRQNEMIINYAGPAGTFTRYSFVDLIEDKVPASVLAGKIVLIGATAESMGDSRVTPFMHYRGVSGEGGREMPGVEIHASIINSIRGSIGGPLSLRALRATPDWIAFVAALAVILCSALAVRWLAGWRQILVLGLILLAVLGGSLLAFSRWLIIPPLPSMLTGFLVVIPLLLNRALAASRELDLKLSALVGSQQGFLSINAQPGAEFIERQLRLSLPQSLTWKLNAVDELTARLLARMSFIDRILAGMGEGVLAADRAGRIVFANREALELFNCEQRELIGADLSEFLSDRSGVDQPQLREVLAETAHGRVPRLEFQIIASEPRYFSALFSALSAGDSASSEKVIGVVALISDVTKRVELDRMKTETLQLVSHELRTPLTSIQGLSDVLLKFPVAVDDSREMLGAIHSEAVRLGETINRYLDLTRLESGAQPLHLAQISAAELIESCIHSLSVFAAERRITLASRIGPDLPLLQVDLQLFKQAINNLISNAVKYSASGTEVLIEAERDSREIRISVCDQGPGIPGAAREKIFEKFYRLERDAASEIVGTGLGLPLVKEIVEQHGGSITVESAETGGALFTIHLKRSADR